MRGLLVRRIPVRLLDLSLTGFLLESASQITVGSTGELRVDLGGARCSDHVRVARVVDRQGATLPYQLGGEFSWGDRPAQDSVRLAVRTIESDAPDGVSAGEGV